MSIDFEKDQTDILSQTKDINKLATKIKDLQGLENEITALEERLKNTKLDLKTLSGDVIPTMMAEMGLTQLKLMDGSSVNIKTFYGASITIKNREAAYKWLRSNGLGDIIKNDVTVSFGMNEDNKAVDYANLAQSHGFQPTQKLKVEPMTLKALVQERIEAGKEMPMDIFNVFVGNRTKLTRKQ